MPLYDFRTSSGAICCQADELRYLCATCRALADKNQSNARDYFRQPPPSGYKLPASPLPSRPSTEATRQEYLRQPPPDGYALAIEKMRKANV